MRYPKDFVVNITRLTTVTGKKGFGTILIVNHEADGTYTEYTNMTNLEEDFANTTLVYKMANDLFNQGVDRVAVVGDQTIAPADLVTLLGTVENEAWFGLVCTLKTDPTITAISAWVNTRERVYAVSTASKVLTGTSNRVIVGYHPTDNMAEALLAYLLVNPIGGVTAKFKQLNGISKTEPTLAEFNTMLNNNIMLYVEKFGISQTANSKMIGGEYIDVILGELWIKIRMEEDLAQLALANPKIPFTSQGIALLAATATKRLELAVAQGIIASDESGVPLFEVTTVPIQDVPIEDKAVRKYDFVKWSAVLAGAIESGQVNGFLTLE